MPERLLVKRFDYKKALPATSTRGELSLYSIDVERPDGSNVSAEVARKPSSPLIPVGVFVEGELSNGEYGWSLKGVKVADQAPHKVNGAAAVGVPSGYEDRSARIERQSCLKVAVEYLRLKQERREPLTAEGTPFTIERVYALVMQLEQFVGEAG